MLLNFVSTFLVLIVPYWNWNGWFLHKCTEGVDSSNCTLLELKPGRVFPPFVRSLVLIVPYWNWNAPREAALLLIERSNCTLLELKLGSNCLRSFWKCVLIVPYWNWNSILPCKKDNSEIVLIVPYWNWNMILTDCLFNLTWVLIVPYWNWNWRTTPKSRLGLKRSNCTLLTGIETRLPVSGGHGYDRSNCTLLELKLFSRDEVFKLGICSNCTLLELKRRRQRPSYG